MEHTRTWRVPAANSPAPGRANRRDPRFRPLPPGHRPATGRHVLVDPDPTPAMFDARHWPPAPGPDQRPHPLRPALRHTSHPEAIEATAVEVPRSWSVPGTGVGTGAIDGWRAPARRTFPAATPSRAGAAPSGDADPVSDRPDAPPPDPEARPDSRTEDRTDVVPDDRPGGDPEGGPDGAPEGRTGGGPHDHPDDGPEGSPDRGREHGDRRLFLDLARRRLAGGVPVNTVHPPPPGPAAGEPTPPVPRPVYANVDPDDLVTTFARSVEEAGGVCHQVVGSVPDALLDHLVAELGAWDVVVSSDPEAVALGERLADRGVEVSPAGRDATAGAALGVTSAVAGVAATGSVVVDSARAGGRLSSVLPPAHLCVLPVERLVATPADVLRPLGDRPGELPSSLVLVTGPSRTGDIEQLLTIGAHGPTALHVIVVSPPPPSPS